MQGQPSSRSGWTVVAITTAAMFAPVWQCSSSMSHAVSLELYCPTGGRQGLDIRLPYRASCSAVHAIMFLIVSKRIQICAIRSCDAQHTKNFSTAPCGGKVQTQSQHET